jgi:hypothetical protein
MKRKDLTSLEPLRGLVEGVVVALDLDNFEEEIERRGWSQWKPNEATGLLTQLALHFASKHRAVVIFGVDPNRGTEEFMMEIPFAKIDDVIDDVKNIIEELNKVGVRASASVVEGLVGLKPARSRREAYYGTPARRKAIELLRKAKASGGNKVLIGFS